jgi:hypothetical protein
VEEDMKNAEHAGLRNWESEKTAQEMIRAIGDSLSDLAYSNNREDGEDDNVEETEQGKQSEDNEPRWVMSTINKTVQQCITLCRHIQMEIDKLTQPGWVDAADYFHERDKKCSTSE